MSHDWKAYGKNRLVSEDYKGYYHFRRYRCRHCGAILIDQMAYGLIVPRRLWGRVTMVLEGPHREELTREFHRSSLKIANHAKKVAELLPWSNEIQSEP